MTVLRLTTTVLTWDHTRGYVDHDRSHVIQYTYASLTTPMFMIEHGCAEGLFVTFFSLRVMLAFVVQLFSHVD